VTNKFIAIFSAMLPNGVVHHISWFQWDMEYCENFAAETGGKAAIGKPHLSTSGRRFVLHDIQEGNPPPADASRVGKPAAKPCNVVIRLPVPNRDIFYHDSPLINWREALTARVQRNRGWLVPTGDLLLESVRRDDNPLYQIGGW
jgi:hypothetical protein